MADEPTQEQIKEFWERCGWEIQTREIKDASGQVCHPISSWFGGVETASPDIDLNSLFKYAVPKAREDLFEDAFIRKMWGWMELVLDGDDPALALLWSLWQVKEEQNG